MKDLDFLSFKISVTENQSVDYAKQPIILALRVLYLIQLYLFKL